jgi:hypothetical protein
MSTLVLVVLVALVVPADRVVVALKADLVVAEVLAVMKVDVPNALDAPNSPLAAIPKD